MKFIFIFIWTLSRKYVFLNYLYMYLSLLLLGCCFLWLLLLLCCRTLTFEIPRCPHNPARKSDLVRLLDDLLPQPLQHRLVLVRRKVLPIDEWLTNTIQFILNWNNNRIYNLTLAVKSHVTVNKENVDYCYLLVRGSQLRLQQRKVNLPCKVSLGRFLLAGPLSLPSKFLLYFLHIDQSKYLCIGIIKWQDPFMINFSCNVPVSGGGINGVILVAVLQVAGRAVGCLGQLPVDVLPLGQNVQWVQSPSTIGLCLWWSFSGQGALISFATTECARDCDLYELVSCCKFVNEILFL